MGTGLNRECSKEESKMAKKSLKRMLNILSHLGNTKQNKSELLSYSCKNGQNKKHWWQFILEKMWVKGTSSIAGGNKTGIATLDISMAIS